MSKDILKEAFEIVQNTDNWKGPIDQTLNISIDDPMVDTIKEAIFHYTNGPTIVVELSKDSIQVTSKGYYYHINA